MGTTASVVIDLDCLKLIGVLVWIVVDMLDCFVSVGLVGSSRGTLLGNLSAAIATELDGGAGTRCLVAQPTKMQICQRLKLEKCRKKSRCYGRGCVSKSHLKRSSHTACAVKSKLHVVLPLYVAFPNSIETN